MAFKDALRFLYERAKQRDGVTSQQEFADRHGVERETINQWLTGNRVPPPKTIWEILEREGYDFSECIELPDTKVGHGKYRDLFDDLEAIILSEDETRIHGISINLHDIAAGARSGKKYDRPAMSVIEETKGNIAPREKKRIRKRRSA